MTFIQKYKERPIVKFMFLFSATEYKFCVGQVPGFHKLLDKLEIK